MAMHINIYLYLDLSLCRPADLPALVGSQRHLLVVALSLDDAWGASPPDPSQQNTYSISGIDNNPAGYTHACLPVDLPNILYCNVLAWGRAGRRAGRKVGGSAGRHQLDSRLMTGPLPKDGVDFRPMPVCR